MQRARVLVVASTVSMVGWGAVLPYQYAYTAQTRGWGSLVAAAAASLFSVGALVAAPFAGRLADRISPAHVAIAAKVLSAVATGAMILTGSPLTFLLAMLVFGVSIAAAVPAQSVLVLRWVGSGDRRSVFAQQFAGQSVGMALGAVAAGYLVDLHRTDGMNTAFAVASAGFALSALLVACAARPGARGAGVPFADSLQPAQSAAAAASSGSSWRAMRLIITTPALRWTAVVTIALALGFYAQFESGLPAYAITILDVSPQTIGTASAVNCLVIVALQMLVVRLTAKRPGASLLVVVGAIWVGSWALLALAAAMPGIAASMFVVAFGVFAVGETMYAPVLNPLTASLAPAGTVGTMLGLFAALQTGVSAAGPMLSGAILGTGHASAFVAVHVVISLVAVGAAWRLRSLLRITSDASEVSDTTTGGHRSDPAVRVIVPAGR
jgi:Na+/melibiose symporter-like transporter